MSDIYTCQHCEQSIHATRRLDDMINWINDAADEHGDLGQAYSPEYLAAYRSACRLLGREPHEMLIQYLSPIDIIVDMNDNLDMDTQIRRELEYIEASNDVTILYACEAGSRVWGFESKDSDYDIRFIYVRELNHYLSLNVETKRDVIEYKEAGFLDFDGWDIRKALKLFKKCNPPLFEWLNSPTIYYKNDNFYNDLKELMPRYYNYRAMCYHYYHMAEGNYRTYLQGDEIWLKKYFYVLRPLLSVLYLMRLDEPPPLDFDTLVNTMVNNNKAYSAIGRLLKLKRHGFELSAGPRIPEISGYIDGHMDALKGLFWYSSSNEKSWEPLNKVFRQHIGLDG